MGYSLYRIGTLSHQLSFKHDVTQPAPTVTSKSERNQNMGKYPQNRLSRFEVEILPDKGAPPQDLNIFNGEINRVYTTEHDYEKHGLCVGFNSENRDLKVLHKGGHKAKHKFFQLIF